MLDIGAWKRICDNQKVINWLENGIDFELGLGNGYDGTGNFPGNRDFPDLRVPGKIPPGTRVFLS